MQEPVIQLYFKHQQRLVADIRSLLLNYELGPWPNLGEQCQEFLERCSQVDISGVIIHNGQDAKIKTMVAKMIEKTNGEPEYAAGVNLINSYIALYHLIKSNLKFVRHYQQALKGIADQKAD